MLQKKVEELKSQTDMSNQKHAAKLEELSSALKEKEDLLQSLQMKLKESEVGLKWLETETGPIGAFYLIFLKHLLDISLIYVYFNSF